jgi:hypothetical protein
MITIEVSPLINICENIDLLDLSSDDTQALLTSGFEEERDFEPERLGKFAESIHAQVSGHPYLTQFLGEQALIHFQNKGILPTDIQALLSQPQVANSKYFDYLYQSIQKYGLLKAMKSLLRMELDVDEIDIRRLGLLGILRQKTEGDTLFRNRLIQHFFEKTILTNQPPLARNAASDNKKRIEEETRLIREARVQGLLERLIALACMQTPESRRDVLTKARIAVEPTWELNGSATQVLPKLFYFLENLPNFENGCHPLGLFLTIVKGLNRDEKETIGLIDAFITLYGLMESKNAVFVSYAWGGESERTVDELELAFAERGISIVRDKKEMGYKDSIGEFERRIGQGQCIILVISDKYLRSEHCMFELVEIAEHQEFRKRVFPIVLEDAQIYKPVGRLAYIKYWGNEIKQLNKAIKGIDILTDTTGFTTDLNKYARIRTRFDNLTKLLSDMNTLTLERLTEHGFATLISAIDVTQHESHNAPPASYLPDN